MKALAGGVYRASVTGESPFDANELWGAGSDDGLVHMTRDGGQNWADVTSRTDGGTNQWPGGISNTPVGCDLQPATNSMI